MIFPQKLKVGDEVRIIAPAFSYQIIGEDVRKIATERLEQLGLKVSFGKNLGIIDSLCRQKCKSHFYGHRRF